MASSALPAPSVLAVAVAFAFAVATLAATASAAVTYDRKALVVNGRRRILLSGSIHYPRSVPEVPASCFSNSPALFPENAGSQCDYFLSLLVSVAAACRCGRI